MTKRRDILKTGAVGLSIPLISNNSYGRKNRNNDGNSEQLPDVTILNNSEVKKSVQLKIFENKEDDNPIFSKGYGIQGYHNPDKKKGENTKKSYNIDVSGDGKYFVVGRAPPQKKDTTQITLIDEGVPDELHITFVVEYDKSLTIFTGAQ
jgi:hypothetical protein